MFHVGDRVTVMVESHGSGTVVSDEGGGDYCVELDRIDPDTGRKKRVGVAGQFLRREGAPRPPVEGMVTKGEGGRTPLTAVLDVDEAIDEAEKDAGDSTT